MTNSSLINSENSMTELNDPHYTGKTLNLTLDLEIHQYLGSIKHVINIIMWIRDTGCYKANHDLTLLILQDYKSIEDYNNVIHKICVKLRFCGKEPSEIDKIGKTFQTMLPSDRILQYQYRTQNYQNSSDLIHDLLQEEKT
jgi:hypothetical protein